jgi:hypothetical protein
LHYAGYSLKAYYTEGKEQAKSLPGRKKVRIKLGVNTPGFDFCGLLNNCRNK